MPQPSKGARIGGSAAHESLILSNLVTQLFEHGKITTTEKRARRMQPLAEKLISKAKRGDLHSRRLVLRTVRDQDVVDTLFHEIAPLVAERDGGYTRITKIGNRKGDNAPMAVIEVITDPVAKSEKPAAKKAEQAEKAAPKAEEVEAEKVEETEAPAEEVKADEAKADEAKADEAKAEEAETEEVKAEAKDDEAKA